MKKLTQEEWIEKARETHKDKYDYSLVKYINSKTKVEIICPVHGSFWQKPCDHANQRQGCPKCPQGNRLTREKFIERAEKIYSGYDYSLVPQEVNSTTTRYRIICPLHGEFATDYNHFLSRKQGCPVCGKSRAISAKVSIHDYDGKDLNEEYRKLVSAGLDRVRKAGERYELHHIVPVSLGGSDDKDNLALLTVEEHFRAHYLLWKMTDTPEMTSAFWCMLNTTKGDKITPELFAETREAYYSKRKNTRTRPVYCLELDKVFSSQKDACRAIGVPAEKSCQISAACAKGHPCFIWKDKLRYHWCWVEGISEMTAKREELLEAEKNRLEIIGRKISAAKKGKPSKNRGKCFLSEEAKKRIGDASRGRESFWKGKHLPEETKRKLREAALGRESAFKGKHHTESTKRLLSARRSQKVQCVESGRIYPSLKAAVSDVSTGNTTNSSSLKKAAKAGTVAYGFHWKLIL